MKKVLKVTSTICVIFGLHYIALGILALFSAGLGAIASLATLSIGALGAVIAMILTMGLCVVMAYLYGVGGIYAIKGNKKQALLNMAVAALISFILLIVSIASKKVDTSFLDVLAVILPIVQAFLLIQTVE